MSRDKTKAQFLFYTTTPATTESMSETVYVMDTAPYAVIDVGFQNDHDRGFTRIWASQFMQVAPSKMRIHIVNLENVAVPVVLWALAVNRTDADAPSGTLEAPLEILGSRRLGAQDLSSLGPPAIGGRPLAETTPTVEAGA